MEYKYKVVLRKRLWFTFQDVYIDENTRISYGFHWRDLSASYWLQRKVKGKWKFTGAWTYFGGTVEGILGYLIYKEAKVNKASRGGFDDAEYCH